MEETNRHILLKAIAELPQHEPKASLWLAIEGELTTIKAIATNEGFNKASKQLPLHEPAPDLWNRIEQELDRTTSTEKGKRYLEKAINDLPNYEPAQLVWTGIENKLDKKNTKIIFIKGITYPLSIAASIALLIGMYWFYSSTFNGDNNTQVSMAYSEEVMEESKTSAIIDNAENKSDDEIMAMVQEHCSSLPQSCENPKFNGLLKQYEELKDAQKELEVQVEENGEELYLQKSLVKIEKEKTKIAKKLFQYLI